MITGIVTAAGESRRMGAHKVLLPFADSTVIETIVGSLIQGGADEVIVVTGHEHHAVASALQHLPATCVLNPDYRKGMLSSIRCGLRAAAKTARGHLVTLGDQPSLTSGVVAALIREFQEHGEAEPSIVVPTHNGRRGHPVLLSRGFRDEVLTSFDDVGLRGLFTKHPQAIQEVSMDEAGVLRDMDTPEDYRNELRLRSDT